MILDYRTPLERFWHDRVRSGRTELEVRYNSMPSPEYLGVTRRMGTAHHTNPSGRWMKWGEVFAKLVKLYEKPA